MSCVDRLGAALCHLAHLPFPSPYRYDAAEAITAIEDGLRLDGRAGRLRVIAEPVTFGSLVETVFSPIRQYGRTSNLVTNRLLETIVLIAGHLQGAEHAPHRAALRQQADAIERGFCQSEAVASDESDQAQVRAWHGRAVAALEQAEGHCG